MDFVRSYEDPGAAEIVVMGIAAIDRISESLIKVTYYTHHKDGNIVPVKLIWDINRLLEYGWQPFEKLRTAMLSHDFREWGGADQRPHLN